MDQDALTHMTKLPLFPVSARPLAGRTDPETSHIAAEKMGLYIGPAQARAYRLVCEHPGSTCPELAGGDERERQRVGRRLSELQHAGLIRREGVRDGCAIWWMV